MVEIKGGDYESCKNMIWKLSLTKFNANKSSRPDVELDDVLSEAFCIYSQCLQSFKGNKGMKFSTYLYQNLAARLNDYYCFGQKEIKHYEDLNFVGKDGAVKRYEDTIVSSNYELDKSTKELFEVAKEELTYEGFIVFQYIVKREWETERKRTFPTEAVLAKHFGYSLDIMRSIMGELRQFWNKTGWLVA